MWLNLLKLAESKVRLPEGDLGYVKLLKNALAYVRLG